MTTARKQAQKMRRATRPQKVRGHGSYSMPPEANPNKAMVSAPKQPGSVNKFARAAGEALGQSISYIPGLGKLIPAPLISAASSALGDAGSWLARAFGFGRYDVRRNSLYRPRPNTRGGPGGAQVEDMPYVASPPQFGSTKKGSDIVFAHREYIGDVKSSINFTATTYPINPGNNQMFPWMSRVAGLFEEYEMLGCLFEYRSTSATAVGTTSSGMGVVVMATDYDCYDQNFTTKRQMEAAEFSSAAVPFETFLHPIECDRSRNVLAQEYVVPGITKYSDAPGDARLSVLGNFTIATEGQQVDGTTIGELWVTYHVKLSRPVLESTTTTSVYSMHGWGQVSDTGNVSVANTKVTNNLPGLGMAQTGTATTARFRFDNTTSKVLGNFLLVWTTRTLSNGITPIYPFNNNPTFGGAATRYDYAYTVTDPSSIAASNIGNFAITDAGLRCMIYTTAFTFRATGDWIEIPTPHGVVAQIVDFTVTQLGNNLAPAALTISEDDVRPIQIIDDCAAGAASSSSTPGQTWEESEVDNTLYQKMVEKERAAAYARPALSLTKK